MGLAETAVARVLRPNKGFLSNASLILVYRSPLYAPRGVGKFLEFVFANTANWPKSRFFSDQKKAMKARIQHKDGQNTQSWHQKQRRHTPYWLKYMGFGC